jgi:hypothetical protein
VLNQVIDTVLARDKEFAKWRADHAHSHVPNTARVRRNRATSVRHSASTVPPPPGSHASLSVS